MSKDSKTELKEGWQAMSSGRVYHYIREGMALCLGLGFYVSGLVPDDPAALRRKDDCAKCFRLLRNEQKRALKVRTKS